MYQSRWQSVGACCFDVLLALWGLKSRPRAHVPLCVPRALSMQLHVVQTPAVCGTIALRCQNTYLRAAIA